MTYSYDRTASTPEHLSKMLGEVLRNLPKFHAVVTDYRVAVQNYLKAADGFNHEDEKLTDELADPAVQGKFKDLRTTLMDAENLLDFLEKHNPHGPR